MKNFKISSTPLLQTIWRLKDSFFKTSTANSQIFSPKLTDQLHHPATSSHMSPMLSAVPL